MKIPLIILLFLFMLQLLNPCNVSAQTDTLRHIQKDSTSKSTLNDSAIPEPDDEFNIFLMVIATAFISIMIGGAIVGAFLATLFLLLLFLFVSAGILSTSVIIGLYNKSVQAGFKSLLVIICAMAGLVFGSGGFLLISKLFELEISSTTSLIFGAAGGLAGGILMGFAIFKILSVMAVAFKRKLNL